jgi:hypothetical protein
VVFVLLLPVGYEDKELLKCIFESVWSNNDEFTMLYMYHNMENPYSAKKSSILH